jgi:hypothetical protein
MTFEEMISTWRTETAPNSGLQKVLWLGDRPLLTHYEGFSDIVRMLAQLKAYVEKWESCLKGDLATRTRALGDIEHLEWAHRLPWMVEASTNTNQTARFFIKDSRGKPMLWSMSATEAECRLIVDGVEQTIQKLRHIEPVPQNVESACYCGHSMASHLFINGDTSCVERPCQCRAFIAVNDALVR